MLLEQVYRYAECNRRSIWRYWLRENTFSPVDTVLWRPSPIPSVHTVLRTTLVTGTGTIAIQAEAPVIVLTRSIVTRVAAGAVRLIGRCRPVHDLAVTRMTLGTAWIPAVIARVGAGHMLKDDRQPVIHRMTVITLQGRDEMPPRLAGCRTAVMAT